MRTFTHGFMEHNRPTDMVSGAEAPKELLSAISAFCANHGIKGGIHNVQAVQHLGMWEVMDWNIRPPGMYDYLAGAHPAVADAGLAHMLGLPVSPQQIHIELRSYWDRPVSNDCVDSVKAHGLFPSWVWNTKSITRICGFGGTKEEVHAKFNAFDASRQ
jgi:hypothetical protein